MSFAEWVALFKSRWYLIVGAVVACVGLAFWYNTTATPQYQANSTLFVSVVPKGTQALNAYQASLMAQSVVTSYPDLVHSPKILDAVVKELDLGETARSLASRVEASNPEGTVLLRVRATAASSQESADIANSVSSAYADFLSSLDSGDAEESPLQVTVAVPATSPAVPLWPKKTTNLALALVAGLGVGTLLMVVTSARPGSVKIAAAEGTARVFQRGADGERGGTAFAGLG